MRKLATRSKAQEDGSVLVEVFIAARFLNRRMLAEKFGLKADRFLNVAQEIELTMSRPKVFVVTSAKVIAKANLQDKERLFLVQQTHREDFV